MAHPSVIALIGKLGVGKTTVAKHLKLNHSYEEIRWSHSWKAEIAECLASGHKVVCDDYRFVDEKKALHIFYEVEVWRILRRDLPPEEDSDFIPFNRTIKNYGSIGELKTAVDGMIVC